MKRKKKNMTQKHFEAFAGYIADFRQTAKNHANMEGESEMAFEIALGCEEMVSQIAKEFNSKFDEEKFRKACQPTS